MVWSKKIQREIRRNRFKGGIALSLTVFLSLSLFSYSPQDSSLNSFGLSLKVANYCGFIGASLADLLYQLFGLSSWLFVLGGLLLAYKFFFSPFRERLSLSAPLFILFLLALAGLAELHLPQMRFYSQETSLGGALGKIAVSSLKPLLSSAGTGVFLWSALALALLFHSQAIFSAVVRLWPKKLFIALFQISKKAPAFFGSFRLKAGKLVRKAFAFLKSLFIVIKKAGAKGLRRILSAIFPKKQKLKEREEEEPEKPRFVFKEKSFLAESPPLARREKSEALPKTADLSKPSPLLEKSLAGKAAPLSDKKLRPSAPFLKERPCFPSQLPSIDILSDSPGGHQKISRADVEDLSKKLTDKLAQFSIRGEIKAIKTGPALVLFEFKPEDHVKVSKIREMESDLSLALSSESVRIIAPIPGRDVVGIEASMPYREMVYLKSLLREESFFRAELPLVLGRRADNAAGVRDLARIPHLLTAGTTGSGKSMFIISFIASLLFRHSPDSLRLLLIDPKQVDLSGFKGIPHLLAPIITSSNKTAEALRWLIGEMEKRYRSLAFFKARDLKSFNQAIKSLSHEERVSLARKSAAGEEPFSFYFEPLPLIVLVIEEFGDLMADRNIRRAVENSVVRLAQKARASGIHLVLAMQSPRKDVVTGLIKTNIPGRISFKVASGTDSRVILDETGAERLLSHGDMLFLEPGSLKPARYHGPFIREKDVAEIANYWKSKGEPLYEEALAGALKNGSPPAGGAWPLDIKEDPMYKEILEFVQSCDVVSASFLQRKFRIGYPRAARLIEILFEEGKIGPAQGSKPREVLLNK